MMNGKNGLIADFVATFNSVRLHPARALCAFTSYFDILRFPVRYSAVLFRFMPFRVNGYPKSKLSQSTSIAVPNYRLGISERGNA